MRRVLVALAAGLALADASIVALALPSVLVELSTDITGVAAVIGVYTLVLAAGILPAAAAVRRFGAPDAGGAGLVVFAAGSALCGVAPSLAVLLLGRAVQAAGGALALLAAFAILDGGDRGRGLWVAAAVFGTAAGPAVGGALTEALDWRAIFFAQVPLTLAAALACRGGSPAPRDTGPERPTPASAAPLVALGALSAALTAVLFLLVLELVAGWSVAPLRAAVGVSVLPIAAVLASRIGGEALTRALAGTVLVAAGTACLAFLPDARIAWTVVPQLLAGVGMGLAFPALAGGLLPERTLGDAARLLVARHVGIVAALLVLAPVVSARLDEATRQARLRGVALVLDAKLDPQRKLDLAPALLQGVASDSPRRELRKAIDDQRDAFSGGDRATYDTLARRADETLVAAVGDAFGDAYLVTAALALLAALALGLRAPPAPRRVAAGALALAAVAVVAAIVVDRGRRSETVALRDPCAARSLPGTGGVSGFLQDASLVVVDRAACKYGSSREELVLAYADDAEAKAFEKRHGVDPRSAGGILAGLFG